MTDINNLSDEAGESWPEDVKGWRTVSFEKFVVEPKGDRTWFLLKWTGEGFFASTSLNLFSKSVAEADSGKATANRITMSALKDIFRAAGLAETDFPKPSARDIASALNAYEGRLSVDAFVGPDGRGYTEATRFAKAGSKVAAA